MAISETMSVREHISGTTRAIFTNFSVRVGYGRGSVLSCRVTKSKGGGLVLGVFFATDNAS